jgi:C-terminal processing protease CtpA/Prc
MANIQVNRKLIRSRGTSSGQTDVVSISIGTGAHGLGLQLADEDHLVVIRGFRTGSAAKQAGVKLNDVLIKINGESFASFQEAIGKLKTSNQGQINLTLRREIIQVRSNS